jgi:hypothetical protein
MSIPASEAPGWSGAALALLEGAVRRHGGWEAWRALRVLVVVPRSLSGLVPWSKGHGRTFRLPPRAEIAPHEEWAVFVDYPVLGATGTFARGALTLADPRGAVVASCDDGRASFRGARKLRRWSAADALYFFGYALTHYHALPFTLGRGRPLGIRRARYDGRLLTGVEVELPADLHTHSRRQTFYFEEDGLLRRHDYVADIIGPWARGAHLWRDFVTVGGLEMATVRHVVLRLGRRATPLVALHAELALSVGRGPSPSAPAGQNS